SAEGTALSHYQCVGGGRSRAGGRCALSEQLWRDRVEHERSALRRREDHRLAKGGAATRAGGGAECERSREQRRQVGEGSLARRRGGLAKHLHYEPASRGRAPGCRACADALRLGPDVDGRTQPGATERSGRRNRRSTGGVRLPACSRGAGFPSGRVESPGTIARLSRAVLAVNTRV